jgi:hypothetical protein
MSSYERSPLSVIEHAKLLLDKSWTEEEKVLIKKMIDNLNFYKSLIPKALKGDIIAIFDMANKIKDDYDILKEKEACETKCETCKAKCEASEAETEAEDS